MDWKKYTIYHVRWQLSAVVMVAPMFVATTLVGLEGWLALFPVHVFGAVIFWYIDKRIFDDD